MVDYKGQISIAYMNSDRIPDIHNTTGNIKCGYYLWRHRLSTIVVNKFDILTSHKKTSFCIITQKHLCNSVIYSQATKENLNQAYTFSKILILDGILWTLSQQNVLLTLDFHFRLLYYAHRSLNSNWLLPLWMSWVTEVMIIYGCPWCIRSIS